MEDMHKVEILSYEDLDLRLSQLLKDLNFVLFSSGIPAQDMRGIGLPYLAVENLQNHERISM